MEIKRGIVLKREKNNFLGGLPVGALPLGEKPLPLFVFEEMAASEVEHIYLFSPKEEKDIFERVLGKIKLEKTNISLQAEKGEGVAENLLKTRRFLRDEPFFVCFLEDLFVWKNPIPQILAKNYQTAKRPILSIKKMEGNEFFPLMAETEKIANKLRKIKKIVSPEEIKESESEGVGKKNEMFGISGRFLLDSQCFDYIKKASLKNEKAGLREVINFMINDGKIIYGVEFEEERFYCGNKKGFMEANIYFSLVGGDYGERIKKVVKSYKT